MRRRAIGSLLACFVLIAFWKAEVVAQGQPDGQLIIAFDVSIAPSFLEPAETPGIGTPFVFLYALHDALVKPLPGNDMAPSLAESWRESEDGLVYEFKLRDGLRFHNGDAFTAEDVKFSFERYRGVAAKLLHARVKAVEIVDAHRVRFVLHAPWPDFLAFYATPATGAAWILGTTDAVTSVDIRWGSGRTGSCAWTRGWSWRSRPTSSTGARGPRSSASSSRASPIARRAWPCSRPARPTSPI